MYTTSKKVWNWSVQTTSLLIVLNLDCWPFSFQHNSFSQCSKYEINESKSPETEYLPQKTKCSKGNSTGIHTFMMQWLLFLMRCAEVKWNRRKKNSKCIRRSESGIQILHSYTGVWEVSTKQSTPTWCPRNHSDLWAYNL